MRSTCSRRITGAGGLPALAADQGSYHHFDTLQVGESQRRRTRSPSPTSASCPACVTSVSVQGANPKDFKVVKTKCRNAVLEISAGCTRRCRLHSPGAPAIARRPWWSAPTPVSTPVCWSTATPTTRRPSRPARPTCRRQRDRRRWVRASPPRRRSPCCGPTVPGTHHRADRQGRQLLDLDAGRRQRTPRRSPAGRPDPGHRHRAGLGGAEGHRQTRRRSRRRLARLARRLTLRSPLAPIGRMRPDLAPSGQPAGAAGDGGDHPAGDQHRGGAVARQVAASAAGDLEHQRVPPSTSIGETHETRLSPTARRRATTVDLGAVPFSSTATPASLSGFCKAKSVSWNVEPAGTSTVTRAWSARPAPQGPAAC